MSHDNNHTDENITTNKYPAKHFINTSDTKLLIDVIEKNPLATLVFFQQGSAPKISHIPFHFNENVLVSLQNNEHPTLIGQVLMAHVSNQHPLAQQLKTLAQGKSNDKEQAKNEAPVTLIFHGEDDYISPYDVNDEHCSMQKVPTWNYVKVHVTGHVTEISQSDNKYQQMITTSDHFEQVKVRQGLTSPEKNRPWSLAPVPSNSENNSANSHDTAIKHMLKAITVFKLTINTIEGRFKLSQNKSTAVRAQIAEQVARRNKPFLAKQMRDI